MQIVGSQGQYHRIQPVGPQADGLTPCAGAGGSGPALLPMEGVQGRT